MEKIFLNHFDELLKSHDLIKAEEYLNDSLEKAIKLKNNSLIVTILNEAIGFYRDQTKMELAIKYANTLYKLISNDSDPITLFISYINIANAYRANNEINKAIKLFNDAKDIYINNKLDYKKDYSALLNNLALAYQANKKYNESLIYFNEALTIIKNIDDIKYATTLVNMSTSYLMLDNLDYASNLLDNAYIIFENNKNDFHYMGYLSARARLLNRFNMLNEAVKYYEEALSNILMHVGKTTNYYEIKDELFSIYDKLNINPHISGIKLSKDYYDSVKEELFKNIPSKLHSSLAIGLFGLGSECYFMDDIISEDHDFDNGFIILVDDNVNIENFNIIKNAYNNLDKRYKRYYAANLDKKGVHYLNKYLIDFLGYDESNLKNESKALITNGMIFYCGYNNRLNNLRNSIVKNDRYMYLENLIKLTLRINQYIPYNINRAILRNEYDTSKLLKNHLIDVLIEYYYTYYHKYLPHDKLRLKMMDDGKIRNWVLYLLNNDINDKLCEEISSRLLFNLYEYGVIDNLDSIYIEDYHFMMIDYIKEYNLKKSIINEIVKYEWDMFKMLDNMGSKANCQSNPEYFKLMREAQFYLFDIELLNSYLNDLKEAKENDYNLLAIKYAFMEESTDINHFNMIKNNLPKISEKRKELQECIISLQLEMMENFNKNRPSDSINMRSIYKKDDSKDNTSYETYLKGELSSYSEKTLYLYGKMLTRYDKLGLNYVNLVINHTYMLHNNEYTW